MVMSVALLGLYYSGAWRRLNLRITYSSLASVCGRSHRWQLALSLLEEQRQADQGRGFKGEEKRCPPSLSVCVICVHVYVYVYEYTDAYAYLYMQMCIYIYMCVFHFYFYFYFYFYLYFYFYVYFSFFFYSYFYFYLISCRLQHITPNI